MFGRGVLGAFLALSGCMHRPPPPPRPPRVPRFTIGTPYQAQGEWRYPRDFDSYDVTGLATTLPADYGGITSDNEVYDAQALTAASPVLQLPAIVTVTNLANGYTMDVRVNERGPADPGRVLAVTPRVGQLLGFPPNGVTEVAVTLKPQQTAALDGSLGQGLKLTAAPLASITAQPLAPPGGSQSVGGVQQLTPLDQAGAAPDTAPLTGHVVALPPSAGPLYVQIAGFGRERDARQAQEALYGIASEVVPVSGGDRVLYAVNAGPYASVAEADAALRQILARGLADPEIIVR